MHNSLLFLLVIASLSYVSCQCNSTEGFLTQEPTFETSNEHYFLNLTEIANRISPSESITGPFLQNILLEENLNVTLFLAGGRDVTCLCRSWSLGDNGDVDPPLRFLGDSSEADANQMVILYFNPPVNTVAMKTNYHTSFPSTNWGPPTFSTLNTTGGVEKCYNIHSLAPISTPSAVNGFAWRGVSNPDGIYALQLRGAQIVGWDVMIIRDRLPPVAVPVSPVGQAPITQDSGSATMVSSAVLTLASMLLL